MKLRLVVITSIIIVLGAALTITSAIMFPMGEMVSAGYRLQGFPLGFLDAYGGNIPGAFDTRLLPVNFIVDIVFWLITSLLIVLVINKYLSRQSIHSKMF